MATLRSPLPDLEQPERYQVKMRRDSRGLTTVIANVYGDSSLSYQSRPLSIDQLHSALEACSNLYDGQAAQAERDLATSGRAEWSDATFIPSDIRRLKLEPVPPFPHTLSNAPVEDKDLTDEMKVVLDQARASLARDKRISHDEILREFEGD